MVMQPSPRGHWLMRLLLTCLSHHLMNFPVIVLPRQCPGEESCTLRDSSRAVVFPGAAALPAPRVEAFPLCRRWIASTSATPPGSSRDGLRMMVACMISVHARCGGAQARAVGPEDGPESGTVTILTTMLVITIPTVAVPLRHARATNGPHVNFVSSVSGVARLRPFASGKPLTLGLRPW